MKRLFLPLALISFAVLSLSIVHIDNINKLDTESNLLREKQQLKTQLDETIQVEAEVIEEQ